MTMRKRRRDFYGRFVYREGFVFLRTRKLRWFSWGYTYATIGRLPGRGA